MQLSNKKNTPKDLSILVHKNGFSFCTQDQHHFFEIETTRPTAESLRSFLNYHQLQQENVCLIYMDAPSVSVPLALFDNQQLENYLKTAVQKSDKVSPQKKELPKLEQVVVYATQKEWTRLFMEVFPKANTTHLSAALLPILSNFSFGKARKNIFIHLRKDYFDLFLFQGGQLLLQNSFSHTNADEFMYYLFYVCEQFYLKPEQFDLFFLGKYTSYNSYYKGTQEFHANIEYLDPIFPVVSSTHPAPFFQSFFPE